MTTNFYASITDLLDASAIPGDIEFIEDNTQAAIDTLLGKVFYKDLVVDVSSAGDEITYSLTLLTKSIRQSLFGTGMELVFFRGTETDFSEFPIVFYWKWSIRKYISGFEAEGFAYTPDAFVGIFFSLAGIQDFEEFFGAVLDVFLDDGTDAYLAFYDEITATIQGYNDNSTEIDAEIQNIINQLTIIKDEVSALLNNTNLFTIKHIYEDYQNNTIIQPAVESIQTSIETLQTTLDIDIDIYSDVANSVINLFDDFDQKFEKLLELFRTWLGDITLEDVKDLLIPQFALQLNNINMALEFPRDFLLPMVETGGIWQVDADEDHKAAVIFTAGHAAYSTQNGFEISILEDDPTNAPLKLPRCMIPNFGLQLEFLGVKLDLSRKYNIAEAVADDRPEDFIGAYIREANIYLPEEWFKWDEDGSTLKLFADNLIIGTGGLSGTIGLAATAGLDLLLQQNMVLKDNRTISITAGADGIFNEGDSLVLNGTAPEDGRYVLQTGGSLIVEDGKIKRFLSSDGELSYKLGKTSGNGQWEIGFNQFYLKFWQNKIQESEIKGFLTVPNFKQEGKTEDLKINVAVFFENNGDFRVTASPEGGLIICLGENGKVFKIKVNSLEAGKDEEKLYLQITGDLDFSGNPLLNTILTKPIEIKKLRIYSDGSFEIEGGSIPIPASVHLNLGPVEVDITNITLGAEKLDIGDYKFIGFDCGVSTGSGGLDLRGDGIKIYFNHDGSDMFLRIAGIGIDLIIPGTASEETAALILKGYLSLKEEEYTGAVSFNLPKAKIAGGAVMKMKPQIPAFAVDAFLELSAPIPLGPTGLGIYGFRGLFGLRYIADLPEGATSDPEKMFDFYTAKKPNPLNGNVEEKGLHIGKIVSAEKDSGTPVSIGAGVSLGTAADAGRAFSMQAFLFLSLPEFFMISGRGNVLSERVSIVSETEPPFFAYMAITNEFISVGMGAEYKVRENEGQFLELNAAAQMAFFFNDASAWYVHFGTKEEPNPAKVLKKIFNLDVYAYLMLSVAGIETGAGIKFEKKKKYGPVSVEVNAYGDIYAMISFRKPQVGGGIACGGSISASVFGVGFNITLDAYLMLTVPKPFMVKGGAEICLEVDFWLWTWQKCVDIEFKWEFEQNNDLSEIKILDTIPFPVSGYHIGSKNTYKLSYFNTALPNPSNNTLETIPLDTFIDIQLKKPVDPNTIISKIGGVNNPPVNNIELVPPKDVEKQVRHQFEIEDINIKVWNANANAWQNYNPYLALDQNAFLQNINVADLKLGAWQKKGKEYNNLRILADSPFSFADNMTGGFIPEQMGITAATLFCPAKAIDCHCIRWNKSETYAAGKWHSYQNLTFKVTEFNAEVVPFQNVFEIPLSLKINNQSKLEIILPEKCLNASLKLFSYAKTVKVSFYDLQDKTVKQNGIEKNKAEYILVKELNLNFADYFAPVKYEDNTQTIKKIVIEAIKPDEKTVLELENVLEDLIRQQLEGNKEVAGQIKEVKAKLESLQEMICNRNSKETETRENKRLIAVLQSEIVKLTKEAEKIKLERDKKCRLLSDLRNILDKISKEKQTNFAGEDFLSENLRESSAVRKLTDSVRNLKEKNNRTFENTLAKLEAKAEKDFKTANDACKKLNAQYKEKLAEIKTIEEKLRRLKKLTEIVRDEKADRCATYLHEVCYLTQTEYWYNVSIPGQEVVETDYDAFNNAVSKVIAPIWRPDEMYAIEIKTNEIINNSPNQRAYYFAFKTAGPIGHFPLKNLPDNLKTQYDLDSNGMPQNADSGLSKKVEIPENSLKFYLDFNKSYPNPNGNIINQKPLFYNNPDLLIFYIEPFVYHFFNNWINYNSLGKRFASMKIEVQDPAENLQPPPNIPPIIGVKPNAVLDWKIDNTPPIKQSLEVVNNLRNPRIKNVDFNGHTCWQIGGDPIVPASKNTEVKVENLKPSKLYNVNIFCRYSKNGSVFEEKQVHSYPFQTSRYADLSEQINSYHLKDFDFNTGQLLSSTDAVYEISYNLNHLGITVNQLQDVISGTDVANSFNPNLIQNYPDAFQRLLFGYLKQEPLHAALNTEINLLRNENNELMGIWVTNPEPFNDPRIPYADLQNSVKLLVNEQSVSPISPLFSKDNSEFIIFHNNLSQAVNSLKLTFAYLAWNGSAYIEKQNVTTENLIQL